MVTYALFPYPWSLSTYDRMLRNTKKSSLYQVLEKLNFSVDNLTQNSSYTIDGKSVVRKIKVTIRFSLILESNFQCLS